LRGFHELMQRRVQRILLVSSLYDSFVISEDGQLSDELSGKFLDLDASHIPDLIQVSDPAAALELLAEDSGVDLVVASLRLGDGDAAGLARSLRAAGHQTPVIALAYTDEELQEYLAHRTEDDLERVFMWQGDVRIFLAMVFYLEDRLNVERDTGLQGVPAILVVEDNIKYYSSFLLTIYSEVLQHTNRLLEQGVNLSQKMLRLRARPKILLCTTFEEAWSYFERYEQRVLGVISDFEFPHGGQLDPGAGLELCRRMAERRPGIRLVLQSSLPDNRQRADEVGASFLTKDSSVLLEQLREVLVDRFGFGDFRFRLPGSGTVATAGDLRSLRERIAEVPGESLAYHGRRGHLSNWLRARTEFLLAERLEPRPEDDFEDYEELRASLLERIDAFLRERSRNIIADFDRHRFDPSASITRIGGGSLGGKTRGVAFANRLLQASGIQARFPQVDIHVPPCVVLGTEVFDEFLEFERTRDFAISDRPEAAIENLFLQAPFPRGANSDLRAFLQQVHYPLAVRSSSLMEDSLSQPFAGIYRTFMLGNGEFDIDVRLRHVTDAVKRIYASTFSEQARTYMSLGSHRLEEEKMAVMIQRLVGGAHGTRFYPDFAGVARSHNFYPEPGHAAEDGVAAVALGMGKAVVGGDPCLRFCPRYPRQILGFSSVNDALRSSQREFYALDLAPRSGPRGEQGLDRYDVELAEEDGILDWIGSTWVPEDNRIVDGISRAGVRLVSFAQVLKHGAYPLAALLDELLDCCAQGMGAPVEIEFAGRLGGHGTRPEFAFLQLRPMVTSKELEQVEIGEVDDAALVCRSPRILGHGRVLDVRDLVIVPRQSFDRARSLEVAAQVASLDARLRQGGVPYLLIGVGRWGSADPHLGIPVTWNQIAGARVIVEAGFDDLRVTPSQGTHFFQNLTTGNVGYFTVNADLGEGHVDWDWLASLPAVEETDLLRHVRLDRPVTVTMDGRTGQGIVAKP